MNDYLCKYNDITVPPKRIVAIIGEGKETTRILQAMAGMSPKGAQKVQYGDEFGCQLKKEPWKLQFVPDDIVCYRNLSAGDFLKAVTMKFADVTEEKEKLLETFDINIEEKLLEMTFEGNRAVAMTASLLAAPTLLLLDKPFDMVSHVMYKKFIKEIVKTYFSGGSVVISAEKYEDIDVLCSDYIFVKNGKADKHFVGRKNLPTASKVVTIWGCSSMPGDLKLLPLCKKGDCMRFIYKGNDVSRLAEHLSLTKCNNFTVEELGVEEQIYSDYTRWML
ncbi:MAG: hypothetical protein IJ429_00475 [Lachnospiraceae bacterium]|nr:hypothetical protein [Lachnospiraceae bacterium]